MAEPLFSLARPVCRAVFALVGTVAAVGAYADPHSNASFGDPHAIHLKQGIVDPGRGVDRAIREPDSGAVPDRLIVQLDGPIDQSRRNALEQLGIQIGEYLPSYSYIVRRNGADPDSIASLDFVRWVGRFKAEWKRDPDLGRRAYQTPQRRALRARGLVAATIILFEGEDAATAVPLLRDAGATDLSPARTRRQWMIDSIISLEDVDRLTHLPFVQYIEDSPEGTLRNDSNEWIVQSNAAGQTPFWDAGLYGQGQIVGLIDTSLEPSHCSFEDTEPIGPTHRKLVAMRQAVAGEPHGTHVAATLAGDHGTHGAPDALDGVAFAARLSFSNVNPIFSSPGTLHSRLVDAHDDGARIHSNSWGDDSTDAYTSWCRQIDEFSYDFEEDLVIFAVTNGASLKSPENAINVLAVGASDDTPNQNTHCSGGTGPTFDLRRKPEVYAPGCNTFSASVSVCDFVTDSGTSMACPVIAGGALLIRQYFTDGYYPTGAPGNEPFYPAGAVVKAVLLNSTVDMTGVPDYPSDIEGWGRLQLNTGVPLAGDTNRLSVRDVRNADGLATGEQISYSVPVMSSAVPLRITMVFTAPPASISTSDPVINDLDLEVIGPDNTRYKGNWLSGGSSVAGGTFDARNNVERVLIPAPQIGVYQVIIRGAAVNQGLQGFGLAITGDIREDCNANGIPDEEDVAGGSSEDCNGNGTPDECEPGCLPGPAPNDCAMIDCPVGDPSCDDCNENGLPDGCDLDDGTSIDCNTNGAPDSCDIESGSSRDANGDGIPDECCPPTVSPLPYLVDGPLNRFLVIDATVIEAVAAVQVTLTSSTDFPSSVGIVKWLSTPDVNGLSTLQCAPQFRDWSSDPTTIHVLGSDIVPLAEYEVRTIAEGCDIEFEPSWSQPSTVPTATAWGDSVGFFDGGTQMWTPANGLTNFNDVNAVIRGFQETPTAPAIWRTDLGGEIPNGLINFTDIQLTVQGFQLLTYPFSAPAGCP